MMRLAKGLNTTVALNHMWTVFYQKWFDPREDEIWEDYDLFNNSTCLREFDGHDSFYFQGFENITGARQSLFPTKSIRQVAETTVQRILLREKNNATAPFISVHRRGLDDLCLKWSERYKDATTGCTQKLVDSMCCNVTYADIPNPDNLTVLLFSDGQGPEADATFPILVRNSFPVEQWMMTLSLKHYGNPMSTVDGMVKVWRHGRGMEPAACFPYDATKPLRQRFLADAADFMSM